MSFRNQRLILTASTVIPFFLIVPFIQADEYLIIPHSAFNAGIHVTGYEIFNGYLIKRSSSGKLWAPVYLPQGAYIKSIHLMYYDNGDGSIDLRLLRKNIWVQTGTNTIFEFETEGQVDGIRWLQRYTCPPALRTVDNKKFSYSISLYFSSYGFDYRIYGVRITYTMPQ